MTIVADMIEKRDRFVADGGEMESAQWIVGRAAWPALHACLSQMGEMDAKGGERVERLMGAPVVMDPRIEGFALEATLVGHHVRRRATEIDRWTRSAMSGNDDQAA